MALFNSVVQLDWNTPVLVAPKDGSRNYLRLCMNDDVGYIGGANLTKINGIILYKGYPQEFRAPESREEFYAIGLGAVRVLENKI